jgi:hypothetical protein
MHHEHTSDHNICIKLTAYSGRHVALLHMDLKSMPSLEPLASIKTLRAFAPLPSSSLLQACNKLYREMRFLQVIRCSVSAHCAFVDSVVKGRDPCPIHPLFFLPPSPGRCSVSAHCAFSDLVVKCGTQSRLSFPVLFSSLIMGAK